MSDLLKELEAKYNIGSATEFEGDLDDFIARWKQDKKRAEEQYEIYKRDKAAQEGKPYTPPQAEGDSVEQPTEAGNEWLRGLLDSIPAGIAAFISKDPGRALMQIIEMRQRAAESMASEQWQRERHGAELAQRKKEAEDTATYRAESLDVQREGNVLEAETREAIANLQAEVSRENSIRASETSLIETFANNEARAGVEKMKVQLQTQLEQLRTNRALAVANTYTGSRKEQYFETLTWGAVAAGEDPYQARQLITKYRNGMKLTPEESMRLNKVASYRLDEKDVQKMVINQGLTMARQMLAPGTDMLGQPVEGASLAETAEAVSNFNQIAKQLGLTDGEKVYDITGGTEQQNKMFNAAMEGLAGQPPEAVKAALGDLLTNGDITQVQYGVLHEQLLSESPFPEDTQLGLAPSH